MTRSALSAYNKVAVEIGVESASPHKLVLMLYEGAIAAISAAKVNMLRNDTTAKGEAISKAIAIIDEGLKTSLDDKAGGELAQNLKALYDYMTNRLLVANLRNELKVLEEVGRLLAELHGAWKAIGGSNASEATAAPGQRQSGVILDREKA